MSDNHKWDTLSAEEYLKQQGVQNPTAHTRAIEGMMDDMEGRLERKLDMYIENIQKQSDRMHKDMQSFKSDMQSFKSDVKSDLNRQGWSLIGAILLGSAAITISILSHHIT